MTVACVDTKQTSFFTWAARHSYIFSYPRKIERGAAKMFLDNIKLKYIGHRFYFQLFQVYVGNSKYLSLKSPVVAGALTKWPPFSIYIINIHPFSFTDSPSCVLHVRHGLVTGFDVFITVHGI